MENDDENRNDHRPSPRFSLDQTMRSLVRDVCEQALRDLLQEFKAELLWEVRRPSTSDPSKEFLSTAEAAELAKVRPRTVRSWVREGQLSRAGVGRQVLVRKDELLALLDGEASGSATDPLKPQDAAERVLLRLNRNKSCT